MRTLYKPEGGYTTNIPPFEEILNINLLLRLNRLSSIYSLTPNTTSAVTQKQGIGVRHLSIGIRPVDRLPLNDEILYDTNASSGST